MIRPTLVVVSTAWMLVAFTAAAPAEILSTGDDTERTPLPTIVQSVASGSCRIAWYRRGGADSEIDRLRALGHDIHVVSENQLTPVNLQNWDVVVLAYVDPGPLADRQVAIQGFVDMGGGLFIHQPNHGGALDYAPVGFQATISSPVWCDSTRFAPEIVTSHPMLTGLTNADLSGAFDAVASLGPAYTMLTYNAACDDPALAVGTSGLGRVVFDTGNGSPISLQPGTEAYWDAIFDFLCLSGPVAVETASWGRVKARYR